MKRMYNIEKPRTKKEIKSRIRELQPYADHGRPWNKGEFFVPKYYVSKCRAEIRILEWVIGKRKRPWYNIEDWQE